MSEMSLEEQIKCLNDMKSYLDRFCNEMKGTMKLLSDQMNSLRDAGLSIETENKYRQRYYNPANEDVEYFISNVYNKHFDYLDRIIEFLEEDLNS